MSPRCSSAIMADVKYCPMPARPTVYAPEFGEWLKAKWAGRSYGEIAQQLRAYVKDAGLKVNRSSVQRLEQGRVPNWPMLYAIAKIVDAPFEEVTVRLAAAVRLNGQDLPLWSDPTRHTNGIQMTIPKAVLDDATRVQQELARVRAERDDFFARLRDTRALASRLLALASTRDENRTAAGLQPRRRAGDRTIDR